MTTEPQSTPETAPLPPSATGAEAPPLGPGGQVAPQQAAPEPGARPAPTAPPPQHTAKRTRTSGLWIAVGFFAVILLFLLIFILQNGQKVDVSYLGAHGHLPLGVALLLAAVCGVILVVLAGTARISQLRAVNRRHRRADAKRAKAVGGPR
jgi:uncharacterized integral membrane protein